MHMFNENKDVNHWNIHLIESFIKKNFSCLLKSYSLDLFLSEICMPFYFQSAGERTRMTGRERERNKEK